MTETILLIHVPKTAGTAIRDFIRETYPLLNVQELHVNRRLECMPWKYLDFILTNPEQKVVLTWRNPIEHVRSTFYFYQEYPHFNCPKNFTDFVRQPSLQNQQTSFLIKHHLFDTPTHSYASEAQDKIWALLNRPNTLCLLQDYFEASMQRLEKFFNFANANNKGAANKEIAVVKRFNFNKPITLSSKEAEMERFIREKNDLDMKIYEHIRSTWYAEATIDDRNNLPEWGAPLQFPLNLIAGKDSIAKYHDILKEIHSELHVYDHGRGSSRNVHDYIQKWLILFYEKTGIERDEKVGDNGGGNGSLEALKLQLNDTSEKFLIITRF